MGNKLCSYFVIGFVVRCWLLDFVAKHLVHHLHHAHACLVHPKSAPQADISHSLCNPGCYPSAPSLVWPGGRETINTGWERICFGEINLDLLDMDVFICVFNGVFKADDDAGGDANDENEAEDYK